MNDSVYEQESREDLDSFEVTEQGSEEPAVTPIDDSSDVDLLTVGDVVEVGEAVEEAASDTIIIAQLEDIKLKLIAIDGHIQESDKKLKQLVTNSEKEIAELQRIEAFESGVFTGLGVFMGLLIFYALYRWLSRFF